LTAWERRWREWLRWELWAGSVLPLLCIGGWVLAVASTSDGAENLRVLFWHNLVGRAVNVGAAAPYAYATAHRNWPGKYLIELLSDLLPWTGLAIAALLQSRKGARSDAPLDSKKRFGRRFTQERFRHEQQYRTLPHRRD